jgi:hypothetical protein
MKQTANDRLLFKFLLSSSLSVMRSIILVIQKEYPQASDFKSWYRLQQEEMEKDKPLTFLKELRKNYQSIKKKVNTRFQSLISVADLFAMPSGSTIVMRDKKEGTYLTNASIVELAATAVTQIDTI